ncbi:glycoprotein precursor [Parker's Farm virus]|nr:glycoprotein precursor [Parker's Farm virus]
MEIMLYIFTLIATALSVPLNLTPGEKCFTGGSKYKEINTTSAIGEFCVKDDVSLMRSITKTIKRDNQKPDYTVTYYRTFIVKDWEQCNPIISAKGDISAFGINDDGTIIVKTYICRANCDIELDKENAEIILKSDKVNHFSLAGSLSMTGWFKMTKRISLESTCEHISVMCGSKKMTLHACFKTHRSCVRYFKNSFLPSYIIENFCQNLEIILLISFISVTFTFLMILSKTYLIYLLLPVFILPSYLYGKLYNKYFKLCKTCLLAVHPFSKCPLNCVCGSRFSNTDALRIHRLSTMCQGYKSLSKARACCKNKGLSFITAVLSGILFFSFITPINSQEIDSKELKIKDYRDIPEEILSLNENINNIKYQIKLIKIIIIPIIIIVAIVILYLEIIIENIFNRLHVICSYYSMIHKRTGLKFNSEFTNKCGECTCGYSEHAYNSPNDYELTIDESHKLTEYCRYKSVKKYDKYLRFVCFIIIISLTIPIGAAEFCYKTNQFLTVQQIEQCAFYNNLSQDYPNDFRQVVIENKLEEILSEDEMYIINKSASEAWDIIETVQNLNKKALYEALYYSRHCENIKGLKQFAAYANFGWKTFVKTHHLHVCGKISYKFICRCISEDRVDFCVSTDFDPQKEVENYYKANTGSKKLDIITLLKTIKIAFPGISSFLIDYYYYNNKLYELQLFLNRLRTSVNTNTQLSGIVNFTNHLLNSSEPVNMASEAPQFYTMENYRKESTDNLKLATTDFVECNSPQVLSCVYSIKTENVLTYLICSNQNQKYVLKDPVFNTIKISNKLCAKDKFCHIPFEKTTEREFNKISKSVCSFKDFQENPGIFKTGLVKCIVSKYGYCTTIRSESWPVVMCEDHYYYSSGEKHSHDGEIGEQCLAEDCLSKRFPISNDYIKNCKWENIEHKNQDPQHHEFHDMQSYIKYLEKDISTNLLIGEFHHTANFPKVIPSFKSMYLIGSETEDGLINSYIQGEIPAIGGLSSGIRVKTPNGNDLFDLIIYIKKADFKANYEHVYTTGPTETINVIHDEKCTGKCPEIIPQKDGTWLTFSREHTSSWGCEEFGCLAIGSGCVFGSCQDVIKPELPVYRKSEDETPDVEFCVITSSESFCTKLISSEPIITEKIQIGFETVQSANMPKLLALKKGKIYSGAINDLGSSSQMCGSVQMANNQIIGTGKPKFDYICHAARRKDIIVRRCFDNHYELCKLLQYKSDINFELDNTTLKAYLLNKNTGTIKYKIQLGDVLYKTFVESLSIDYTVQCAGCIRCTKGISCHFKINSESAGSCKLKTTCENFQKTIQITPGDSDHYVKILCKDDMPIEIELCNNKKSVKPTIDNSNIKLELNKVNEPSYIKESDNRCGTWLCKVSDEGISIIWDGLFGDFSKITKWVIVVIISIFGILIMFYLIFPCCKRLKGLLEYNERLYQIENKKR